MEKSFTKEHTRICKGFAILLMVYHHLFIIPERLNNNYISELVFGPVNLEHTIAVFGKLCVGLFLFLSGYGLYCSLNRCGSIREMYRKVVNRLKKFYLNLWIIGLIVFPIGCITGFFPFSFQTILRLMTGFYPKIMEWWFVCQYVVLLLISPLLISLIRDRGKQKVQSGLILVAVYAFVFLGDHYCRINAFFVFIFDFASYLFNKMCLLIFLEGIVSARYDAFRFFVYSDKQKTIIFNLMVLIGAVTFRVLVIKDASMKVDFLVTPLLVFSFSNLISLTRYLKHLFSYFSKHSTNIWLTHTFWCYYLAQQVVLLPRYSTLIYLWLLILSLLTSYFIKFLQSSIQQRILREHYN